MSNGELRQANLKMLFQKAKQYESANFKGLYNFIKFIDKLKLSSGDLGAAKLIGENDNVIRIMSIHKSKGLEFPVVFLSNTGKQFNLTDLNKNVLLHQEMGIGVKYIDYDRQIQYDTLSKAAIKNKILEETLSEEMRILYVALTRAKEKLLITGIQRDYQKETEKMIQEVERYPKKNNKINPILVKNYKNFLNWILLVYYYEKDRAENILKLNLYTKQELVSKFTEIEKEEIDVIKLIEEKDKNKKQLEQIQKILNYSYPYKIATIIPTKTSVTKLKQMQLQGKTENDTTELPKPEFLKNEKEEKLTGTQKGSLVHLCLQNLNEKIDYDIDKIKELIQNLVEKQIITKKEGKAINPLKILKFTKSNIWKELKEAKQIEREKPFYINIPAKEIYQEEIEEEILVQGIIDLYYIDQNDNLILVDYKTDYIEKGKENELVEKYKKQLEIYQQALEQVFSKKVTRKYIYSTYLNKQIEI